MARALYSCDGTATTRCLEVNHRRGVDASARFLLQFFCIAVRFHHRFVVAHRAAFAAVQAGVIDGFFLHDGEGCNRRLAAIQHNIAARDVISVFFSSGFFDEQADAIKVFVGQSVGSFLLL